MYEKMTVANACGGSFAQHSLRENLSVPDGMADIFAALNAAARPIATNVSIEDSTMTVEGLLFTRIIYRSSSNRTTVSAMMFPSCFAWPHLRKQTLLSFD